MKDLRQLASNLTREEKLKYISSDLSEAERNEMADKLTLMEVQFIDGMKVAIREDLGETPKNKKKADDMTEALLDETLKEINKK
jgi:predicted secreted protein